MISINNGAKCPPKKNNKKAKKKPQKTPHEK